MLRKSSFPRFALPCSASDRLLTTSTLCSNYCGEFDNFGAVMSVSEDLLCAFELLKVRTFVHRLTEQVLTLSAPTASGRRPTEERDGEKSAEKWVSLHSYDLASLARSSTDASCCTGHCLLDRRLRLLLPTSISESLKSVPSHLPC